MQQIQLTEDGIRNLMFNYFKYGEIEICLFDVCFHFNVETTLMMPVAKRRTEISWSV